MKFSIIYEAQMVDTSREAEAQAFHDIIEQCLLAEELGFDRPAANSLDAVSRKTGLPQDSTRSNGTPLHSAQFAAPFRQPSSVTPGN